MASSTSGTNEKKLETLICESISHLRRRKARPDFERIWRLMRRHSLTPTETEKLLARMVSSGEIMKVVFKGNSSYRLVKQLEETKTSSTDDDPPTETAAAKPVATTSRQKRRAGRIRPRSKTPQNSASESRRIQDAVRAAIDTNISSNGKNSRKRGGATKSAREPAEGARINQIANFLAANRTTGPNNKKFSDRQSLLEALHREVNSGSLLRLANGNFVIHQSEDEENDDETEEDDAEETSIVNTKRSTPGKFKKSARPVHITTKSAAAKSKLKAAKRSAIVDANGRKRTYVFGKVKPSGVRLVKREVRQEINSNDEDEAALKSPIKKESSDVVVAPAAKKRKLEPASDHLKSNAVVAGPSSAARRSIDDSSSSTSTAAGMNKASLPNTFFDRRLKKNLAHQKTAVFRTPAAPVRISNRLNKRKRFKKTHGPDFVENYDSSFEEPISKCDYCHLTGACNRIGEREDLLVCKDCSAKAHPSCMSYSLDLARRSRLTSWQCFDCKICCICEIPDDPDTMLFCDTCDKGYHMVCHSPEVTEKPNDHWRCRHCHVEAERRDRFGGAICSNAGGGGEESEEVEECGADGDTTENAEADAEALDSDSEQPPTLTRQTSISPRPAAVADETKSANAEGESSKCTVDGETGLPTPCDSPIPEAQQNKQPFLKYFGQRENSDENKENVLASIVPDATDWSVDEVEKYIKSIGFTEQAKSFVEQEIDGKSLLLMQRNDVLTGLSLKLGPALKIYKHVRRLQVKHAADCGS